MRGISPASSGGPQSVGHPPYRRRPFQTERAQTSGRSGPSWCGAAQTSRCRQKQPGSQRQALLLSQQSPLAPFETSWCRQRFTSYYIHSDRKGSGRFKTTGDNASQPSHPAIPKARPSTLEQKQNPRPHPESGGQLPGRAHFTITAFLVTS